MEKSENLRHYLQVKEQIIDNLEIIQDMIENCTEQGLLDEKSSTYNELLNVIEEANLSKTYAELADVIYKAKEIEYYLETWISLRGGNTLELSWPILEKD